MNQLKYIIPGLLAYLVSILYLHFSYGQPYADFLPAFIIVGVSFSLLAWLLTLNIAVISYKPPVRNEIWFLVLLILWIFLYITYGSTYINLFLSQKWSENPRIYSLFVFVKKFFVFIIVPFLIYRFAGFTLKDFGLRDATVKIFSLKSVLIFVVLSSCALIFQFFFGMGSKPVREGAFATSQLVKAVPLTFIYLLFDAGFIEEFFFRGVLQSRISALLKSATGGIVVSALIFGLVHAPGLYLRGAESEGISEQLPLTFWMAYTILYMSVAGVFIGIIFHKTRNLWLVMAIHAMVDLLPGLPEFIHNWRL